uniref:Uncharacterized protein n=1 Tax=Pyxicephalus adspersus TaxID=30357 RepID=A0AAV2ZXN9_PYXAD|nr:TPA: hypothetical protein GDO54_003672 [Pyxicephalus adspersus]
MLLQAPITIRICNIYFREPDTIFFRHKNLVTIYEQCSFCNQLEMLMFCHAIKCSSLIIYAVKNAFKSPIQVNIIYLLMWPDLLCTLR